MEKKFEVVYRLTSEGLGSRKNILYIVINDEVPSSNEIEDLFTDRYKKIVIVFPLKQSGFAQMLHAQLTFKADEVVDYSMSDIDAAEYKKCVSKMIKEENRRLSHSWFRPWELSVISDDIILD